MSLPTTSKEVSRRIAFRIGEKEVSEIARIISDENTELKVSFSLSDGTRVSSNNLSDLLNFANSNIRSISNIRLRTDSATRAQASNEGSLDAGVDGQVRYNLSGNDDWVLVRSRNLEELLDNSRLWWSVTYTEAVKMSKLMIVFFGLVFSFLLTYAKLDVLQELNFMLNIGEGVRGPYSGVFFFFLLITWLHIVAPMRAVRRLFPVGSFCIGGGSERFRNSEHWRRAVMALVILSIPGGLLVRAGFSR